MKTNIVILVLGIISVIVRAEAMNQNNDPSAVVSELPQHKPIEDPINNDVIKQDRQEKIKVESDLSNEVTEQYDAEIDVVIEESIEDTPNKFITPEAPTIFEASPNELILPEVSTPLEGVPNEFIASETPSTRLYEAVQEAQIFNPYADGNVILKEPGEIMETAEGFVPIPIFRNRQKQRRRFVTRRNFQRYPFRRFHFFYPYSFYHPSSLSYYSF